MTKRRSTQGETGAVSMTGFGRATSSGHGVQIAAQLRSVNNRHLDAIVRLPEAYAEYEVEIRALIAGKVARGRVELSVTRDVASVEAVPVKINWPAFDAYAALALKAAKRFGVEDREGKLLATREALQRREVFQEIREPVSREERALLIDAVGRAVEDLVAMRAREGARLAADLKRRITTCQRLVREIEAVSRRAPAAIRDRLRARIAELSAGQAIDPARLASEVALIADRSDVSEEIARLQSHCAEFLQSLAQSGSGKRLDFLLQEMNREFNTIGSKVQDATLQQRVVDAKVELEKLREQVQNIE